jgi:hypothetical protein
MYLRFVYESVPYNPDLSVHVYVHELIKFASVAKHLHDLSVIDMACFTCCSKTTSILKKQNEARVKLMWTNFAVMVKSVR